MLQQRILMSLMFACATWLALPASAQVGGWSDAKIDDASVVGAAKFAVKETQKKHPTLKLTKLLKAKKQLVAGMNYQVTMLLTEAVDDKPVVRKAVAVVYVNLDDVHSLTSWSWKKSE